MLANTNIKSFRLRPSLYTTGENYSRRRMISVRTIPTITIMPPLTQGFLFNLAALRTYLRSITRTHLFVSKTGAFSLVLQYHKEASPASIQHRSCQSVVLDHPLDVQALHHKSSVAIDQIHRNFMMSILSYIRYFQVQFGNNPSLFFSTIRSFFLSTQTALGDSKFAKIWLHRLKRIDMLSITSSQETFQPNVNTNNRLTCNYLRHQGEFANRRHIPFIQFSFNINSFNCTFNEAMQIDSYQSNMLKPQFITYYPGTISATRWKRYRMKLISCFESRVARLSARFNTAKERFESLIQIAHCCLSRGKIDSSIVWVYLSIKGKLGRLFHIINAMFICFIRFLSPPQTGIVKSSVGFKGCFKFPSLIHIWFKSIFESFEHLLSLLRVYIHSYCYSQNLPYSSSIITTTPKSRQSRTQRRKLPTQYSTSETLQSIYNFSNPLTRVKFYKYMDIIWIYIQRVNYHFQFFCLGIKQYPKPLFNILYKHRAAVFGAPYQMQFKIKNCLNISNISCHVNYYKFGEYISQVNRKEGVSSAT